MAYPRQRNLKPRIKLKQNRLKVTNRISTPSCPFCWEDVVVGKTCNRCGMTAHKDCIKDMSKSKDCPTVGCSGKLKKKRQAA